MATGGGGSGKEENGHASRRAEVAKVVFCSGSIL